MEIHFCLFFFFLRQNFCVTSSKGKLDQGSGICHSALVNSKEKILQVAGPQEEPTHRS